jgi:hypothetical protein
VGSFETLRLPCSMNLSIRNTSASDSPSPTDEVFENQPAIVKIKGLSLVLNWGRIRVFPTGNQLATGFLLPVPVCSELETLDRRAPARPATPVGIRKLVLMNHRGSRDGLVAKESPRRLLI